MKHSQYLFTFSLIALLSIIFFKGVLSVPFHPDESTYIFMSQDFNIIFENPLSLSWEPGASVELKTRYRLIDAPLGRYLIGFGRWLFRLPAQETDWNWSKTWVENQENGALPDETSLLISRLSITALFPISLLLIFSIIRKFAHYYTSMVGMLLYAFHALVLLHTRRSMAEGVLVLGILLFLWSLTWIEKKPLLAGVCLAVAFNAKHSALALLPMGVITIFIKTGFNGHGWLDKIKKTGIYMVAFSLSTLLLNPVYWKHPIQAPLETIQARKDLLARQMHDIGLFNPEQVLDNPSDRILAMIANVYILQPSFYEVGNYVIETQQSIDNYTNKRVNNLCRGLTCGGVLFFITISGIFLGLYEILKKTGHHIILLLLFLTTILQFLFMVFTIPLPWQRYVIPIIPFEIIWITYGIDRFAGIFINLYKK